MKKIVSGFFAIAVLAMGLFTSCDDKNENHTKSTVEKLEEGVMNGSLSEDYILDATVQYNLTGQFIVEDGYTLTIPEGTQIVADAGGTDVYIAVMMGAKIEIDGTSDNPVVMSSASATAGDWGGLTLCGKAITTAGTDATAEVGGFIYGGTDSTDNSGSIKYLVIKGTGAQIDSESQYNGVSFYAVGSATVVENLAVINGADDGVEFFGGSVSVTNIFLENDQDDAIDWTEGWNGTVTNAYVQHTEDFSTVIEGDKDNKNPKFVNLTAVSTVGGTALQFKKESGATITGLSLTGYSLAIDMKDDGPLDNVIIEGEVADTLKSYTTPATVDPTEWTWIDATITDGVTDMLEDGIMNGVLTTSYSLDAAVEYNLTGSFIVSDGVTFTIPAGTKIIADDAGTEVYIAVMMGGKIDIAGTNENPVVITSEDAIPGDWGGLTLCGKAITTAGTNATAEVGGFIYGGTDSADNSGSIKYLVIKGTGAQIDSESQYNGVSLYAVGSGTTLENIAVINGADDGVEFFGGSASITNIYLEDNQDDAVDWTEGWDGGIVNTYILHEDDGFSTAFEGDKDNNWPEFTNVTAICTATDGGTALQFKKESGAIITNLYLSGYTKNIDMKDGGALSNVQIDGADADVDAAYNTGTQIDISGWTWKDM